MTPAQEEVAKALIKKRRNLPVGEKLCFAERNIINMYLKRKPKLNTSSKPGVKIPVELRKKGF